MWSLGRACLGSISRREICCRTAGRGGDGLELREQQSLGIVTEWDGGRRVGRSVPP